MPEYKLPYWSIYTLLSQRPISSLIQTKYILNTIFTKNTCYSHTSDAKKHPNVWQNTENPDQIIFWQNEKLTQAFYLHTQRYLLIKTIQNLLQLIASTWNFRITTSILYLYDSEKHIHIQQLFHILGWFEYIPQTMQMFRNPINNHKKAYAF